MLSEAQQDFEFMAHRRGLNLNKRCKYGYLLETLSRKKASNAAVRISTHGLCFTNQVIELARKYKEEDS